MPNGNKLSIAKAKAMIKAFEAHEIERIPGMDPKTIAIGHKLDLALLEEFMQAIKDDANSARINAVRIYLAKSKRASDEPELYDIVLVPVLDDDKDLHTVYDKKELAGDLTTLIGNSLPCPNVCPRAFHC